MRELLPIALTMGEPAGIGGEIAVKAWRERRHKGPSFFLIDDPSRMEVLARNLPPDSPVCQVQSAREAREVFPNALPVISVGQSVAATPGRPDPRTALSVKTSIEMAVAMVAAGAASAVVTNPIHKQTMAAGGFAYPGHTEYLASLAGLRRDPVMMLVGGRLRVVPLTIHVPLASVPKLINADRLVDVAGIVVDGLQQYFAIRNPRIVVAGLNPHAGEGGTLGHEEDQIIVPAMKVLQQRGLRIVGPLAADSMFHSDMRRRFDVALCMYHDQALIPLKTLAFHRGVNVTLGLPFVRTSPDHGTALDLAGTGRANAHSLLAAIDLAATMFEADTSRRSSPLRESALSR